jgi:hypothetical protein
MKKSVSKQTFLAREELYLSLPWIPRLPWFQKLTLPSQVPAITNSNLLPLLICAEAPNTLSLQKNTFKLRADQKQNPVNRSNPEILSKNQPTFPSQLLPFTIFTPKIISRAQANPKVATPADPYPNCDSLSTPVRKAHKFLPVLAYPQLSTISKKTRIPCPSFRRVYTFFTYSAAKPFPRIPRIPWFQASVPLVQQKLQPTRPKYLKFQKVAENSKNAPQKSRHAPSTPVRKAHKLLPVLACAQLLPTNTFSLHKNTLNKRPGRDVLPPASQTRSFFSLVPAICPSFPSFASVDRSPSSKLRLLSPSQVPAITNSNHLTNLANASAPNTPSLQKNTLNPSSFPSFPSLIVFLKTPPALRPFSGTKNIDLPFGPKSDSRAGGNPFYSGG